MHPGSDDLLQDITDRIKSLKVYSKGEVIRDIPEMATEMRNILNLTESRSGIPPPDDLDCSCTSISSSISMPDMPLLEQLGHIKDKNRELRKTATLTMQDFKNATRNLLSQPQLQSGKASLILNELETVKRNLEDVFEESKTTPSNSTIGRDLLHRPRQSEENLGDIYLKIKEIQKEINDTAQRLLESEKLILTTEEKNFMLETRINKLENSANSVVITEGPEASKNEHCMCILS